MNLKNIMDDNYLTFYMLSDNYVQEKYSEINVFVYITKKIFWYIKKILFHFVILIKYFPQNLNSRSKIIFYSISKNNYDSLFPVYKELQKDSIFISGDYRLARGAFLLPIFIPLIISVFFIPVLIIRAFNSSQNIRKRIILYMDDILLSIGFKIFVKYYLKILKPKTIVFANDHSFYARSLVMSAEGMNIPCFYIQHSAITEIFPPIISSFALLEGKDSINKYYPNGYSKDNVFLIGSPKFDKHYRYINKNLFVKKLGICSTLSMKKEQVLGLVQQIKNKYDSIEIIFRPHPSEIIKGFYQENESFYQVSISNSLKEDSFYFLRNVDAIISGNSSILLEASMMNVFPIFWNDDQSVAKYNDDPADKYGFIKNGLAVSCDSILDIIDCLEKVKIKKPDVRTNASYYIENINTDWDCQSADYAAAIIKNNI